ncbi:MAG TPA: F0F1 ATP synthase subunit B [Solirubrobacteraceae bacterium]|jgi:F-type H+-transporting ATPase subunit b|nr:F0F1 ATP synthase subunit B [Solirubrobacteraceae bacterium]
MTPLASSSGSFLISPNVGLMIWTLVVFGISVFILKRAVYPRIREALDRRQQAIEESIDSQERLRGEAEQVLAEYRDQLAQARVQAEEIVTLAREAGKEHERETLIEARERREKMLEQTKHDIEIETQRALEQIRKEVATLTILATEKVMRRALSATDQRKLVEEALGELDFTVLEGSEN